MPEDDMRKGEHRVAMISYGCWMRRWQVTGRNKFASCIRNWKAA